MLAKNIVERCGGESEIVRNVCKERAIQGYWDSEQSCEFYRFFDDSCIKINKGLCTYSKSAEDFSREY